MSVSLLVATLLLPAWAADVDTYSPAGSSLAGDGGLQVPVPAIGAGGAVSLGTELVYARRPLVQEWEDGTVEPLVEAMFATRLLLGYTLRGGVRLDVDVPLYPLVDLGPDGGGGFAVGDLRVGVQLPIAVGERLMIGLIPTLVVPTGRSDRYVGAGGMGAGATVAVAGRVTDGLRLGGSVGGFYAPDSLVLDTVLGSKVRGGLAVAWLPSPGFELGVEGTGQLDLAGAAGEGGQSPVEAHVYGSWSAKSGFTALLGGGAGLVAGVGGPQARVLAGVGWRGGGGSPHRDGDHDGVFDVDDACVTAAEDQDEYQDADGCPDPDDDLDGVLDGADACRQQAEDLDGFEDGDGCPDLDDDHDGVPDAGDFCPRVAGEAAAGGCPDGDRDQVADESDRCPTEPGPASTAGCPDVDADGVPDRFDACPEVAVEPERIGTGGGCPTLHVDAAAKRIDFQGTVSFEEGTARLTAAAAPLLDELAVLLKAHPEIKKLEVGGHTDADGDTSGNLRLSKQRAQAVVDYLVERGISRTRLVSKGYGEMVPLDTNLTARGRARNRRVELTILE